MIFTDDKIYPIIDNVAIAIIMTNCSSLVAVVLVVQIVVALDLTTQLPPPQQNVLVPLGPEPPVHCALPNFTTIYIRMIVCSDRESVNAPLFALEYEAIAFVVAFVLSIFEFEGSLTMKLFFWCP